MTRVAATVTVPVTELYSRLSDPSLPVTGQARARFRVGRAAAAPARRRQEARSGPGCESVPVALSWPVALDWVLQAAQCVRLQVEVAKARGRHDQKMLHRANA